MKKKTIWDDDILWMTLEAQRREIESRKKSEEIFQAQQAKAKEPESFWSKYLRDTERLVK